MQNNELLTKSHVESEGLLYWLVRSELDRTEGMLMDYVPIVPENSFEEL